MFSTENSNVVFIIILQSHSFTNINPFLMASVLIRKPLVVQSKVLAEVAARVQVF